MANMNELLASIARMREQMVAFANGGDELSDVMLALTVPWAQIQEGKSERQVLGWAAKHLAPLYWANPVQFDPLNFVQCLCREVNFPTMGTGN